MSAKKYSKPRGTQDFLPEYLDKWNYVERVWRETCRCYGYRQITTPMFEHTELFLRTAGDTSDIVTKEMYTFNDKGGRSITLKPEGTASVVRAYFENNLYVGDQPVKFFYIMPMFRYERPQAGRFRQHYQYGVECIGKRSPYIDVEVMSLFMTFYRKLQIIEPLIWLNSLGCPKCRVVYREKLIDFLNTNRNNLCELCQIRLDKNPLRVLDCKNEDCHKYIHNAPTIVENLCEDCSRDYEIVKSLLKQENIPFMEKPTLVRGLDYYNGTVFEVAAKGVSEKEVIAGGGRYDALLKEIGGIDSSAFGAGAGMERLIKTMEDHHLSFLFDKKEIFSIVSLDKQTDDYTFNLCNKARENGYIFEYYDSSERLGNVLKKSGAKGVSYAILLGLKEFHNNSFIVKNLDKVKQKEFSLDEFDNVIKSIVDKTEIIR